MPKEGGLGRLACHLQDIGPFPHGVGVAIRLREAQESIHARHPSRALSGLALLTEQEGLGVCVQLRIAVFLLLGGNDASPAEGMLGEV